MSVSEAGEGFLTVEILRIAYGGEGVGPLVDTGDLPDSMKGISVFVLGALPGELVRARVVESKKRYIRAQLEEVIRPSRDRVEPECRHYGVCGSCDFQHMSYDAQLKTKRQLVVSHLEKSGITEANLVEEVVRSEPYGYRRRISLHVSSEGELGFFEKGSRRVVDLEQCPVSAPQIRSLLPALHEIARVVRGVASQLSVESDDQGVVVGVVVPAELSGQERSRIVRLLTQLHPDFAILERGKVTACAGRTQLSLPLTDVASLNYSVGGFSQVNWGINRKLVAQVVGAVKESRRRTNSADFTVLDLYAGAGNFSRALIKESSRVIAVESSDASAGDSMRLPGVIYHHASVEKFLCGLSGQESFDSIIADPPRSGLGPLVKSLPAARQLVLIGCDLAHFARDVANLVAANWKLKRVTPFDMFPQTTYVEVFAEFEG